MTLSKLEKNILSILEDQPDTAFKADQLAQKLNYRGTKQYKKLVKALAYLDRINQVQVTPSGAFKSKKSRDLVTGTFRANDKGYGFVHYDPDLPDFFVPPSKVGSAMDGDQVEVQILKKLDPATGKGSEAEVIQVLDRQHDQVVGEFFAYSKPLQEDKGYLGYVKPRLTASQDLTIQILPGGIRPVDHSICLVKIKDYPDSGKGGQMTGYVAKEIGHRDEPGVDILEVLYRHKVPHEFPSEVLEAAQALPDQVQEADLKGRKDYRDQLVFTMDGADAKDLDDAISLEVLANGHYQLGVHIADVSHYVAQGGLIDQEAFARGTSVYLTDRVVPMLPQRLSNGICSLHPHEDRLTLSCIMEINPKGRVVQYDIHPSVIHSSYRMTYEDVNAILDGDLKLRETYLDLVATLEDMAQVHKILARMRRNRGALDFDSKEAKIIVDDTGHPVDIQLRERGTGERMIESFMLAANETVARHFDRKGYPFIYRIHEDPDPDRLQRFAEFMTSFGVVIRGDLDNLPPKTLQKALDQAKEAPYEEAVSMMLLRSMQQAKYSDEAHGHYGLAARDYTHFTSPIRRYPDLTVHRLIHTYSPGQPSKKTLAQLENRLPEIADHSSMAERRAVDAERETVDMKKAEYMADRIGQTYPGKISSVTSFGFFVQLANSVEGLVSLDRLSDDYYHFHANQLLLVGERTGKAFRIGQKVQVEVSAVNVSERQIDFSLLDYDPVEAPSQLAPGPKQGDQKDKKKKKGKKGQKSGKKQTQKSKPAFVIRKRK